MSLLAWAEAYGELGWPVVPLWGLRLDGDRLVCRCGRVDCSSPGKHPHRLARHGLHDATCSRDTIRRWWAGGDASANIGLVCGPCFEVLDIDHTDFDIGTGDLPVCETDGGPVARTGAGKWHLYFAPSAFPRRIRFSTHCDWLGIGGYVVAPPSLHVSGGRYEWFAPHTLPLRRPPLFLANMVAPRLAPTAPNPRPVATTVTPNGRRWSPAGLIGRVAAAVEGERNSVLHWAAARIGDDVRVGKVDHQAAVGALEQLAVVAERAGLGRAEVDATIRSGYRGGGA